jgi:hypothetical protein
VTTLSVVIGFHRAVKSAWGVADIRGVGRLEGLSNDLESQPTTSAVSAKEAKARLFFERIAAVKIDIVRFRQSRSTAR